MDDRFLHDARREPRPEFAADLRERLRRVGRERPAPGAPRLLPRLAPALALAAAALAAALLFTLPSVRASAQAFLDLFRVRNFSAVAVDPARIEQLRDRSIDLEKLIGERIEKLRDPGAPRPFPDPHAAGLAAGFPVRVPGVLPDGLREDSVYVQAEGEARLTVDAAKLREIAAALAISDVPLPPDLDGAQVTVRKPPVVVIKYRAERREASLVQARSPEVSLPQGLDLERLGEFGLRVLGLAPAEARRIARSVDWRGTLLVPVPADASTFSEVGVGGNRGLLVTTTRETDRGGRRRAGSIVMWSDGEMVYALAGNLDRVSLLEMANSVR